MITDNPVARTIRALRLLRDHTPYGRGLTGSEFDQLIRGTMPRRTSNLNWPTDLIRTLVRAHLVEVRLADREDPLTPEEFERSLLEYSMSDYVFISTKGDRLPRNTVSQTFLKLMRQTGLRSGPGTPGPRIHDLRHTFAVRALEGCPEDGSPVGWRLRALSTYLGHGNPADTCWYLQATPDLRQGIADACERFLEGGAR